MLKKVFNLNNLLSGNGSLLIVFCGYLSTLFIFIIEVLENYLLLGLLIMKKENFFNYNMRQIYHRFL